MVKDHRVKGVTLAQGRMVGINALAQSSNSKLFYIQSGGGRIGEKKAVIYLTFKGNKAVEKKERDDCQHTQGASVPGAV